MNDGTNEEKKRKKIGDYFISDSIDWEEAGHGSIDASANSHSQIATKSETK